MFRIINKQELFLFFIYLFNNKHFPIYLQFHTIIRYLLFNYVDKRDEITDTDSVIQHLCLIVMILRKRNMRGDLSFQLIIQILSLEQNISKSMYVHSNIKQHGISQCFSYKSLCTMKFNEQK